MNAMSLSDAGMSILALGGEGDIKGVIITLFLLVCCAVGWYFSNRLPTPIRWFAWFIIGAIAMVITYRFLLSM